MRPQAHFYPEKCPDDAIHTFYDTDFAMASLMDVHTTQMALLNHGERRHYDIYIHERDYVIELRNNGHGWDCDYSDKDLRYIYNLFHLWWAGEFTCLVSE